MKKYTGKKIEKLKKQEENPIVFHTIREHNNRATECGQIGRLTKEEANIALQYFNYRCAFSGEKFIKFTQIGKKHKTRSLSLEHIIALTTGGNSLAYNCVPSIWHYNLRKSIHHPLDWWKKQKNRNNEPIFHPIRLLKLVNYMMKSLKGLEEKEIKKYKKIVLEPNEIDKFISQNARDLISNVKTIELKEVPYNLKIPKLRNRKIKYEPIKLDLFLLDCINLLEEYKIPSEIIKYLKKQFKKLKEINKVFEKIPEEEKIQKELIKILKSKKIENVYTVARSVNLGEIRKRKIKVEEYLEGKLRKVKKALEKNKMGKNQIYTLLDVVPTMIEEKEEQEVAIQMIKNFKKSKSEDIKKYFSKLQNRVEAEDSIFIKNILKNIKDSINYLSQEEIKKLEKKLRYNSFGNKRDGRRLKKGYESLYQELKAQGIKESELKMEASKAYIYSKVGPDGFMSIQDNDKYCQEVKNKVLKNYKKGILELDFYLLEDKKDKPTEEADKELTNEILERLKPFLKHLDDQELKILKRRLKRNSRTCKEHGTRLINVYNRIYYAMKKQGLKEPQLSIEASKAYIYSKIAKVGFYSIQCNETKYKDRGIEKILNNYQKEFIDISYYLLDNKTNISKREANEEITNFVLENTKEVTSSLTEKEKLLLKKQLQKSYGESGNKTNRLVIAYNKIYYVLKKQGLKEPNLTKEACKVYLYAKIARANFMNILQKEKNSIENNIIKILEEYEEELKKLDFYLMNHISQKRKEKLDEELTQIILTNTKEIIEKLDNKEQEKLKEILMKNSKVKENRGIKLINAYNRIYYEMKQQGMKEPELTQETCKAYLYAKVSEFGFSSLLCNDKKYTNRNLKRLLHIYKKEIENIGYYLLDNQYGKSVKEADKELTSMVLANIKEIMAKLDINERKVLKAKLEAKSKSNIEKGMRLIGVYNKIYYAMKKRGMKEPELTQEACKAYTFSKISGMGFTSILKEGNKEKHIRNVLNNYQIEMKNINYYLLKNNKENNVEEDNKKLVQHILKHTQTITDCLSKEEQQKLKERLSYSMKSDLEDGIRQLNAYHRIYCEMRRRGVQEPQLTQETCKAYLYAKIGPISCESLIRYDAKRTEINLQSVVEKYKEGIKRIDYYLIFEKPKKKVKESDEELTEYVMEKAKDIIKNLSTEKQKILKEKLLYNMPSHVRHRIRLRNAYYQILYRLKKQGLQEPELSREASKAYIYSKIISKRFSSIIQSNKKYTEKNLQYIIKEYKEGIKHLDCYLHVSNKENNLQQENIKLIDFILANTEDIRKKLSTEENEKIKQKLLERYNKNNCMVVFNRIYYTLKRKEINEKELNKRACRVYVMGEIGPIGFESIVNNERKYRDKNLNKIIELAENQIEFLDYYLMFTKDKRKKEENRNLTENIYAEIIHTFPNLTQKQKIVLRKKLTRNNDELRFSNAYHKIKYTLKKLNRKGSQLDRETKQIYAYVKIRQKGFYELANNRIYHERDLTKEKIKECLNKFQEIDFYLLEDYEEKGLKEADKLFTQKVLEKSEIIKKLSKEEERKLTKLLLKNKEEKIKLVMAYNRIYFELSKKGLEEPQLTKETSKAYIYSKIARCGFSEIQDNTLKVKLKIQKLIQKYEEGIKDIKFYLLDSDKQKDESDKSLTEKILEEAKEILKPLSENEKKKLKEKLIYNANKRIKLIKVYRKIYYELMKRGVKKDKLSQETAKAYIYAKIGPDGFCDVRDNAKRSTKILEKIMNHYSEGITKIKYYLLDFLEDKKVEEADKILIRNVLTKTKVYLGDLYNCTEFIKNLNYNSQDKSKMIIVYNKIYFELSQKGIKEPELTQEASKAFIYAKIGPEGFKQILNGNKEAEECVLNVIQYYKKGLEIIKQDYKNRQIDFTKRILYQKRSIRKRMNDY